MKSEINLDLLLKDIKSLDFWFDGSGAEMSIKPASYPLYIRNKKYITSAIEEIQKLTNQEALYIMINRLGPKVEVPIHTDTLKEKVDRYHLPIITNYQSFWWDRIKGSRSLKPGIWYGPMPYWVEHSVANYGETERIHLIVDLKIMGG